MYYGPLQNIINIGNIFNYIALFIKNVLNLHREN